MRLWLFQSLLHHGAQCWTVTPSQSRLGGVGGGRSTEHLVSSGEGTVRGWTRLPAFLSEVSGEDQGTSQGQQRAEMEMNGFWGTSVPS